MSEIAEQTPIQKSIYPTGVTRRSFLLSLLGGTLGWILRSAWSDRAEPEAMMATNKIGAADNVVLNETFAQGMDNWWVEGGEDVWTAGGKLYMKADSPVNEKKHVCTAWCKTLLPKGDLRIRYEAQVISSSVKANNINLFFCYSDPGGRPLYETRTERASGDYTRYHNLSGYIVTFLNDWQNEAPANPDGITQARIRIRRCPGFRLLNECFAGDCRIGRQYFFEVVKRGNEIAFSVNGRRVLSASDHNPISGGLLGLRTFKTFLCWSKVQVDRLI